MSNIREQFQWHFLINQTIKVLHPIHPIPPFHDILSFDTLLSNTKKFNYIPVGSSINAKSELAIQNRILVVADINYVASNIAVRKIHSFNAQPGSCCWISLLDKIDNSM
jgi:hypothetical protein